METKELKYFWNYMLRSRMIPDEVFNRIEAEYSAPNRYYHNIEHILQGFKLMEDIGARSFPLQLAWLLHDVVYDPKGKHNETGSVCFMHDTMKNYVDHADLVRAASLILATAHVETPANSNSNKAIIIDIDLSILGSYDHVYDEYCENIRKEYSWVDDETFNFQRKNILKGFLAKSPIYNTDYFRAKFEHQAIYNMKREIKKLEKGERCDY